VDRSPLATGRLRVDRLPRGGSVVLLPRLLAFGRDGTLFDLFLALGFADAALAIGGGGAGVGAGLAGTWGVTLGAGLGTGLGIGLGAGVGASFGTGEGAGIGVGAGAAGWLGGIVSSWSSMSGSPSWNVSSSPTAS